MSIDELISMYVQKEDLLTKKRASKAHLITMHQVRKRVITMWGLDSRKRIIKVLVRILLTHKMCRRKVLKNMKPASFVKGRDTLKLTAITQGYGG